MLLHGFCCHAEGPHLLLRWRVLRALHCRRRLPSCQGWCRRDGVRTGRPRQGPAAHLLVAPPVRCLGRSPGDRALSVPVVLRLWIGGPLSGSADDVFAGLSFAGSAWRPSAHGLASMEALPAGCSQTRAGAWRVLQIRPLACPALTSSPMYVPLDWHSQPWRRTGGWGSGLRGRRARCPALSATRQT